MEEENWWYLGRRDVIKTLLNCFIKNRKNLKILDAGCGAGSTIKILERYGKVTGIDINENMVKFCRKNKIDVINANVTRLPFKDDSFDLVVILEVLEHLKEEKKALAEIYRVLKFDGLILISVPAFPLLWGNQDIAALHKRRYSKIELIEKVQDVGFSVIKTSYMNFLLFLPISLFRLMRNAFFGTKASLDSEIFSGSLFLNHYLSTFLKIEALLMRKFNLPFGITLFCVAQKKQIVSEKPKNIQEQEEEFHDKWAKNNDVQAINVKKYFTAPTATECRYVFKKMGNLKGKTVLDLGCGFGEASIWFAMHGANVISLDISSEMLKCVKNLSFKYGVEKNIVLIKSSAEKIGLSAESVDIVFGGNVLHHTDVLSVSGEVKRILKPKGKAFFIEPLGYNILINIYRKMARKVRTETECPFSFEDVKSFSYGFKSVSHKEFQLFTTLIFVWFFIGERLPPGKVRYWKRFIEKGEKYTTAFRFLENIDKLFLKIPIVRRWCWNTVIELVK